MFRRLGGHRPPFYNGESDPVKLENWIDQIDKVLEVVNCLMGLMVKITSLYLKDNTSCHHHHPTQCIPLIEKLWTGSREGRTEASHTHKGERIQRSPSARER